ncbi:MAG: 3-methyl-2-oxobutanoate hydroxymethyltransferase [Buchnera aphidicola (Periphyllus aceris)]|nr:3-methyl-2-oxobutanoate hydroxymethyltransferase [Buchnera aphidicola (Periphyllus aceris)]
MKKINIYKIYKWKLKKHKFSAITAYDFSFSKLFSTSGIPILLVGDSLGMVIQGKKSTLEVKLKHIKYHTKAVRKGSKNKFIISDLPFMTFMNKKQTLKNACSIIQSGANMIKIEGGIWIKKIIKYLAERSILTCCHIGLKPQNIHKEGEYKIQGKSKIDSKKIFEEALILEKSGTNMILLECVPNNLAKKITKKLKIPVIGIGSGPHTDGQILVMHDMLGITQKKHKFVKIFLKKNISLTQAIKNYIQEVKLGKFPSKKHTFF